MSPSEAGQPRTSSGAEERKVIRDRRLLARLRRLAVAEYAGLTGDHRCVEPECNCRRECPPDRDPICGLFRNPAVCCIGFEVNVLGLDPRNLGKHAWNHVPEWAELAEAYRQYMIGSSSRLRVKRCATPGCPREVTGSGPAAKYCGPCAARRQREAKREYARQRRMAAPRQSIGVRSR